MSYTMKIDTNISLSKRRPLPNAQHVYLDIHNVSKNIIWHAAIL